MSEQITYTQMVKNKLTKAIEELSSIHFVTLSTVNAEFRAGYDFAVKEIIKAVEKID